MPDDMSDGAGIGPRVKAARERLGWSREELAFRSGLSWSAIAQVESGRRTNVRPRTLEALSRPLRVSIDYLVSGSPSRPTMLEHLVFPYRSDDQFRTTMGAFLAEGLERSEAVVAVTTPANMELLRDYLGEDARRVAFADSSQAYRTPVATLEAFRSYCETSLARGAPWIRTLGERDWADRPKSEIRLWTRYESLMNLAFRAYPLTLVCPYDERSVDPEMLRDTCLTHPLTLGEYGISESPEYADPSHFALES